MVACACNGQTSSVQSLYYVEPTLCLFAAASAALRVHGYTRAFGNLGIEMMDLMSASLPLIAVLHKPDWRFHGSGVNGARDNAPNGVLNSTRWKATDDMEPSYLTLYNITSDVTGRVGSGSEQSILHQLSTDGGTAQFCTPLLSGTHPSTTPEQLPGKHLLAVWVSLQPGKERAFVDWYEGEHMPMLEKIPGWLCGRLYTIAGDKSLGMHPEGRPEYQFLAVHQFSKGGFMETEELKASQNTPWLEEVMEHITDKGLRLFELDILYERVSRL
ncbi:hypothetical protein K525DRAFT_185861 [Schizophyllum commune Loenen D]|nr:hypothetical protein K525DRAFT_185861 [Schizophyllum commune Loenen D]